MRLLFGEAFSGLVRPWEGDHSPQKSVEGEESRECPQRGKKVTERTFNKGKGKLEKGLDAEEEIGARSRKPKDVLQYARKSVGGEKTRIGYSGPVRTGDGTPE